MISKRNKMTKTKLVCAGIIALLLLVVILLSVLLGELDLSVRISSVVSGPRDFSDLPGFVESTQRRVGLEEILQETRNNDMHFSFANLPLRKLGVKYHELTTYNPLGKNGDFSNYLYIDGDEYVMFEDYGPGVVFKIFLLIEEGVWRDNFVIDLETMDRMFLSIKVDGHLVVNVTLKQWHSGRAFPFLSPLSSMNGYFFRSGLCSYVPIPYRNHVRLSLQFTEGEDIEDEEGELRLEMIKCLQKKKHCPLKFYHLVSHHKFPVQVSPQSNFEDWARDVKNTTEKLSLKKMLERASHLASNPLKSGPNMREDCSLVCQKLAPGGNIKIFQSSVPGVINSILFRLYDQTGRLVENWGEVLITMAWDGRTPQVKDVPLGELLSSPLGALNEANGLITGLNKRHCTTRDAPFNAHTNDWVGYTFFPMPFWESAEISITTSATDVRYICHQISSSRENHYRPSITGYFNAQRFGFDPSSIGHKLIFNTSALSWGHLVGVHMHVHNSSGEAGQFVQSDVQININHSPAPTILGTGLEEFFGFSHGFAWQTNTTYSFSGNPFCLTKTIVPMWTCSAYRHFVFDPIPFETGIMVYQEADYEGRYDEGVFAPVITADQFSMSQSQQVNFVSLFYGRDEPGAILSDTLIFTDAYTASEHGLFCEPLQCPQPFELTSVYEGHGLFEDPSLFQVLPFEPKQTFQFKALIEKDNVGVILHREYCTLEWNQKSEVYVDGMFAGVWFCPQGALQEERSIRTHEFQIGLKLTLGKTQITVKILTQTLWLDIKIDVYSVISH